MGKIAKIGHKPWIYGSMLGKAANVKSIRNKSESRSGK
jgi:hypothetical protein